MDYELLFKIANISIMPAWALLIFAPQSKLTYALVYSHAYPFFLGLFYAYLLMSGFGAEGGMGSLAEVRIAFDSDTILLAGWVHYLVFDLFIGSWEVQDAHKNGIRHLTITPALVFTLLFGPIGLLIYLIMRQLSRKSA